MLYDKDVYEKFINNKASDVLKKYLYEYKYEYKKDDFHFIIGMSLLKMGYIREANIAFKKAIEYNKEKYRNKLFYIVSLLHAQKYIEANNYINNNIIREKLTQSELAVFIEIENRLNIDTEKSICLMKKNYQKNNTVDNKVMLMFGYNFNKNKEKANSILEELNPIEFSNINIYLEIIKEAYKLKLKQKSINIAIDKIKLNTIDKNDVVNFLKCIYGVNYYNSISLSKKNSIKNFFYLKFDLQEIKIQLACMDYDFAEINNDNKAMNRKIEELISLNKKNNNEQALAYIISYSFKNNKIKNEDKIILKNRIEKLLKLNNKSIKYRGYYFEFLMHTGCLAEAETVTKATIALQKLEEKKEFELIKKFYSYYDTNNFCIFNNNKKHEEECPLCFGTNRMPIIKTIAFGHSPNEIFTDEMIKRRIEVNEKTLKEIVNWQPMNVPSKLVGNYLHSLGAYTTTHDFPKVLVPGQTYIFIQLKTESYKRLAKQGFSLEQIDPLSNIFMGINKFKIKENIFNKDGIELNNSNINCIKADDLVIEIIKSISSK